MRKIRSSRTHLVSLGLKNERSNRVNSQINSLNQAEILSRLRPTVSCHKRKVKEKKNLFYQTALCSRCNSWKSERLSPVCCSGWCPRMHRCPSPRRFQCRQSDLNNTIRQAWGQRSDVARAPGSLQGGHVDSSQIAKVITVSFVVIETRRVTGRRPLLQRRHHQSCHEMCSVTTEGGYSTFRNQRTFQQNPDSSIMTNRFCPACFPSIPARPSADYLDPLVVNLSTPASD